MNKKTFKRKYKIKPYSSLEKGWTKISNEMMNYISNPYTFTVYAYLCMRYNSEYEYSFPSLETIAKRTGMSRKKVFNCIKWLEEKGLIIKYRKKGFNNYNNCYYIRYIEPVNIEQEQEEIVNMLEKEFMQEGEEEIIIELDVDEEGKILNS